MKGKTFTKGDYPTGTKLRCTHSDTLHFTKGKIYSVLPGGRIEDNRDSIAATTSRFVPANRHKHYDLIVAWAEGAEIQWQEGVGRWTTTKRPSWSKYFNYRIKPDEEEVKALKEKYREQKEKLDKLAKELTYLGEGLL